MVQQRTRCTSTRSDARKDPTAGIAFNRPQKRNHIDRFGDGGDLATIHHLRDSRKIKTLAGVRDTRRPEFERSGSVASR